MCLFSKVYEVLVNAFKEEIILLIPKGERNSTNYRPISLQENMKKISGIILNDRLQKHLEEHE